MCFSIYSPYNGTEQHYDALNSQDSPKCPHVPHVRSGTRGGAWGLVGDYGDEDLEERPPSASLLHKNFATSAAVRDFNASMPVVHVPTKFKGESTTVRSDPRDRL